MWIVNGWNYTTCFLPGLGQLKNIDQDRGRDSKIGLVLTQRKFIHSSLVLFT